MGLQDVFKILAQRPYFNMPSGFAGWLGWLCFLGLLIWAGWRWQEPAETTKKSWKWLVIVILALLVPVVTLFFGKFINIETAMPIPGLPVAVTPPLIVFLSAVPWGAGWRYGRSAACCGDRFVLRDLAFCLGNA